MLWAEVERREAIVKGLQANFNKSQQSLGKIEGERQATIGELAAQELEQRAIRSEIKDVFETRVCLERDLAQNQCMESFIGQLLGELEFLENVSNKNEVKLLRNENLLELQKTSSEQIQKLSELIRSNQSKLGNLEDSTDKISISAMDKRVSLALLDFKRERALRELAAIEKTIKEAQDNLNVALTKAQNSGERIAVVKSAGEIQTEMGLTDGHLAALASVSEEIERQYESYSKLYLELKEKAQLVAENREKTLEEVKTRMAAWHTVVENLLERVNVEYQRIMGQTLATGEVLLSNVQEIETAGLEIYVGFKGSKPVALDAYTQSGGERTTATMGFLLALQQHVRSPFRAVDEYDVHMDPKNREMIAKVLVAMIKDAVSQYVVITPSQITFAGQDANVITVQNLEGKSLVREVVV
ncbi:MAG: hypothetical protein GX799_07220 [Crenarchaeota archaeon]|nr:hypothetical protein [Thermoproteota archaeon]